MNLSEIIHHSKKSTSDRPTRRYAYCMGAHAIWIWLRFLAQSSFQKVTVEFVEAYIIEFSKRLLKETHTTLVVHGRAHITPGQSYVYMSNHRSLMDIPVIMGALPPSVRMVAKSELFKVPLLGSSMKRGGFLPIDRKNIRNALRHLENAKNHLHKGISIWIAPEGSRSRDHFLRPFKKGGFHLALDLGVPIVPVWIDGAERVMQADSLVVTPNQTVTVYIGKPIPTHGLTKEDMNGLVEKVRQEMTGLSQE